MKIHQNYITLFLASLFGLVIGLSTLFSDITGLYQRMAFGTALFLVAKDVLAGVAISRGKRGFNNPHRWVAAFYLAWYFGTFMLLLTWRGMAELSTMLPGVVLGALVFGLSLSFMIEQKPYPYSHQFNTEQSWRFGQLGRLLHFVWPAVVVGGVAATVGLTQLTTDWLFFTIILLGSALPRYARVANGSALVANAPRILGYLLLIAIPFSPSIGF